MKKWILITFLILVACNKPEGTSTGNPLVAIQFKSYSTMSVDAVDAQAISSLILCLKRLRFKPVSGLDENIDLALGETTIVTTGTLVATVEVPVGSYSRVEFDLNSSCLSGRSVQLTNSAGSFSSAESMTIRFDGALTVSGNQNLDLNIQVIIDALNTVASDSEIKVKAESVGGTF